MTFRQALTLTALFAGFAVYAQAASIIADADLNAWKLHGNGTPGDWTPNSLVRASQNTDNNQSGLAPNILKELMPNIRNEAGGFAIYLSRDNSVEYFHESISEPIRRLYESGAWSHGSVNNSTPHTPWYAEFKHPAPIKAWVLVNHISQLFYIGKPFPLMASHKNSNHSAIEASVPLLSFDDIGTHSAMHDGNDENQLKPEPITVPEPASLALLLLGLLALAAIILLQREKALLSCPAAEPFDHKAESKSRFSSAKLLRRDVRNNILLFKFLHQRQRTVF